MLARTPHFSALHLALAGTANVHQVASGTDLAPGRPLSDCVPCGAVSIPREKLEPSGPASLSAVPDSPAWRGLSHAETVNERRVLTSAPAATAACPARESERAAPKGLRLQPAPAIRRRSCPAAASWAVMPRPSSSRQWPVAPGGTAATCGLRPERVCEAATSARLRPRITPTGIV